jgi:hypothetical protein
LWPSSCAIAVWNCFPERVNHDDAGDLAEPFGAGKTATSKALSQALGGCRTFDPEWIGAMLEAFMVPEHIDDFQNWPLWRALVVKTLTTLCAYTKDTILVPMTVLDRDVAADIFGGLAAEGVAVIHILLDVEQDVLRERIRTSDEHPADAALSEKTRKWRLSKVDEYLRARP